MANLEAALSSISVQERKREREKERKREKEREKGRKGRKGEKKACCKFTTNVMESLDRI